MPYTGRARSLTPEQVDEIHRLREQGLGWRRIAQATGISIPTVRRYGLGLHHSPGHEPGHRDPAPDAWDLDQQPYGPDQHRRARQALGLTRVTDIFALSKIRDPFYCGTPAQARDAQWFGQLWRDLGMPDGTHPRRVHYKADAKGVLKPDGTRYRNNDADWEYLLTCSVMARFLDKVHVEAFTDRRSGGVSANVSASRNTDDTPGAALLTSDGDGWDGWQVPQAGLPGLDPLAMPQAGVTGYEYEVADQPVLIEVWCEKSTMDDILVPLCQRLGVNLASEMKGYESITHIVELLRRAETYPARKAVVLYISDHDHAGGIMPVYVARQCQFWAAQLGIDAEVFISSIVLTDEQVEEFGLPKAPDSKDRLRTELDALEALHPGELERIVEAEIGRWRDPDLAHVLTETGTGAQRQVTQTWETGTGELATELAAIRADADALIDVYRPVIEQLNQRLADGPGQRLADLARRTGAVADDTDWNLPGRPEPEDPEALEDTGGILYDSNRHWLDQIQAYRAHKGEPPLDLAGGYGDGQ